MTLTTRLAIAMIALVAIAVSAVGWLSYRNLEQALLQRARDRIATHSRQLADDLEFAAADATGEAVRRALDRIRALAEPDEAIYVVNRQGDYLVHPDRTREGGGLLGKPNDWRADFPHLAALAGARQGRTELTVDEAGQPSATALAPVPLAGSSWMAVIAAVPNAVIMAPAASIRSASLLVGGIAVLCAAMLAFVIARSLTRPIVRLTRAVQGIPGKGLSSIPVEAGGETGVLARAFAEAIEQINAKTAALEREVHEHRRTVAARDHHAERESLFSGAVESSSDAIITTSLDGTITGWNSAAERLYGYSAAETLGKNIALLVPPDRRSEIQDELRRIGWGETIEHNETVRLRKDGSRVEVSLAISPIKAPSGAIIGISKVARDIAEANRTRQALRQQTEEMRRVFETSQDLIIVMDSRGYVVQISPSCRAILGYRPEEMIGRSGADFMHPDHLDNSRAELRAARGGLNLKLADTRCIRKDGQEVWLSWLGTWSGPAKRFFCVGRDMTESRRAQEALRESERLARGIINTALDAFVQIDDTGVIRDWSAQAENILGWPRDEVLGRNVFALMGQPDGQGPLRKDLEAFLLSGNEVVARPRRELVVRRRDGEEIMAELSVAALRTRDGFLFNAFIRDLTDRIAAEERIRQAEKMEAVGQLTGGIAHDFNNILTVITGTIEILAAAVKDEPQLVTITRMIDEAASRGADLTQHLLAYARKQPLEPKVTDVNTLIVDTAKLLQRTLGEHVEIDFRVRKRKLPGFGRSQPAGYRHSQPGAQRARRDAQWRQGDHRDRVCRARRQLCEDKRRRATGPLCDDRSLRYRNRCSVRHARQGIRPVRHIEGARQGHGPRPEHGLRLHQAVGRTHHDR